MLLTNASWVMVTSGSRFGFAPELINAGQLHVLQYMTYDRRKLQLCSVL